MNHSDLVAVASLLKEQLEVYDTPLGAHELHSELDGNLVTKKVYGCHGCAAKAEATYPSWAYIIKHEPECRYLKLLDFIEEYT